MSLFVPKNRHQFASWWCISFVRKNIFESIIIVKQWFVAKLDLCVIQNSVFKHVEKGLSTDQSEEPWGIGYTFSELWVVCYHLSVFKLLILFRCWIILFVSTWMMNKKHRLQQFSHVVLMIAHRVFSSVSLFAWEQFFPGTRQTF